MVRHFQLLVRKKNCGSSSVHLLCSGESEVNFLGENRFNNLRCGRKNRDRPINTKTENDYVKRN